VFIQADFQFQILVAQEVGRETRLIAKSARLGEHQSRGSRRAAGLGGDKFEMMAATRGPASLLSTCINFAGQELPGASRSRPGCCSIPIPMSRNLDCRLDLLRDDMQEAPLGEDGCAPMSNGDQREKRVREAEARRQAVLSPRKV
jgi:hypothetical protein